MTIGERIARIRKENNLSQEAFGEALGVTRQAISKWEADANIPDVDKLMTMSRLYGVSVGYILGMEEENSSRDDTGEGQATGGGTSEELTEAQLRMVEEIVKRYIDAMPKAVYREEKNSSQVTSKKKPRRWMKVLCAVAVIGLIIHFYNALDTMKNQYQNLQNNLYNVQHTLNNQSSNLTHQIKEILENQNALLVDSGYEIDGYDLIAETVTLSMHAEPKTYAPGMKVYFGTNSDGQELTVEGTADGHRYSGQITCTLTDSISMFVRIERDGVTETQIMDYLGGLRYASAPDFGGHGTLGLWNEPIGKETTQLRDALIAWHHESSGAKIGDARVAKLQGVLYINYQEYQVFELTLDNGKYLKNNPDSQIVYSTMMDIRVPLKEGDTITVTTRMTDTYGRIFESIESHFCVENGIIEITDYPGLEDLQRASTIVP